MTTDIARRRKRSARFTEIALEAGVSVSTVDRVLNERGSVSDAARLRVIQAARALDVPRILPETRHGVVHIDIVLADHQTPFLQRLRQAVQRAIALLPGEIIVHTQLLPLSDESAYERAILHPPYPRAGLIVLGPETPRIYNALMHALDRGESLATIVSDLPHLPPHHFAGIDNYQAGRTAGFWVGRLAKRKGSVLILHGMHMVRAHHERTRGCAEALRKFFPTMQVQISPETHDDPDRCYRYVMDALKKDATGQREPLVAVYDTGYGSPGIDAALHRAGVQGTVVWIGHEMLDTHRQYLSERTMDLVIDQNPDGQVQSALQHLLHRCGLIEAEPRPELREFSLYSLPNLRTQNYLD
jgi:LacI family transcriptional regulator